MEVDSKPNVLCKQCNYCESNQGYPTTKSFQIHQKCLKWISSYFTGLFSCFGAALKIFICSDILGELWSLPKFEETFLSHPKILAIPMGLAESSRTPNSHISIGKFQGTFSL